MRFIQSIKRKFLIRSAQKKLAGNSTTEKLTSDEINALAYEPLKMAMESVRSMEQAGSKAP